MRAPAVLLLLAGTLGATCVVSVWTPESVVIAADSREELVRPDRSEAAVKECKIQQVGPYFVAVAGITEHRPSGFEIWHILRVSVAGTNSLPEAAEAASKEIAARYAEVLDEARTRGPAYTRSLESNAPQFSMAGFSGGRPYLARYSYDRARGRWFWNRILYPGGGDAPGYSYLCDGRAILAYQRRHPRWRRDDPVKTAVGMIAAAAGIDGDVGPPIAVLVLDRTGAHWRNPGICR